MSMKKSDFILGIPPREVYQNASLPPAQLSSESRIIVVRDVENRAAALLVDRVTAVLRVTGDAILPAAQRESGAVEALCARGDEFISLLNLTRVLEIDAEF